MIDETEMTMNARHPEANLAKCRQDIDQRETSGLEVAESQATAIGVSDS